MAYSTGGLIEAVDYNNLAWGGTQGTYTTTPANVAYVMGIGTGEYGYGQDISSINTVAGTNAVTATQWASLLTLINNGRGHQGGASTLLSVAPSITSGNTITQFANMTTYAVAINTNHNNSNASGSTLTGATDSYGISAPATSALSAFRDAEVTFATAQHARYFFNAGGKINCFVSAVDNAGTTRSVSARDLVTNSGGINGFANFVNTGRSGTGGTLVTNNTTIGYRDLTSSETEIVRVSDVAPYAAGYHQIVMFNNTDTTNGANGRLVAFRSRISMPADDAFGGAINLTHSMRVDIVYPESTYLTTNAWGTPTIAFNSV